MTLRIFSILCTLLSIFIMYACSSSGSGAEEADINNDAYDNGGIVEIDTRVAISGARAISTTANLPGCNGETDGQLFYIQDTNEFMFCDGQTYQTINLTGAQGVPGEPGEPGTNGLPGPQGEPGEDGATIYWRGPLNTPPADASIYDAYFNTTDGSAYIYNGTEWEILISSESLLPFVVYTTPVINDTGVNVETKIEIVFNRIMNCSSLNEYTFFITKGGESTKLPGSITCSERSVTLTPLDDLKHDTTYTVNILGSVQDMYNSTMGYNYEFSFKTRSNGNFERPEIIFSNGNSEISTSIATPKVVFDHQGNGLAVWETSSNELAALPQSFQHKSSQLWTAFYNSSYGWHIPELLCDTYKIENYEITFDAMGNSFVIWNEQGSNADEKFRIKSAMHINGSDWKIFDIFNDEIFGFTGDSKYLKIAADSSGIVYVVWLKGDNTNDIMNVYSNKYIPVSGWEGVERISEEHSEKPSISAASYGNAIIIWKQGAGNSIFARRYSPGDGWQAPELVADNDNIPYNSKIVIDSLGNGLAVWCVSNGVESIYAGRYLSGEGWNAPEPVYDGSNGSYDISINEINGHVHIVAWSRNPDDTFYIRSNRYIPGSGWGELTQPFDTKPGPAFGTDNSIKIESISSGYTLAAWGIEGEIYSSRYIPDFGWQSMEQLDAYCGSNQFAMDLFSPGLGLVVWNFNDAVIYSTRFNE